LRKSRQPANVAGKRRASLYAGITIETYGVVGWVTERSIMRRRGGLGERY
jgi:hypothetical protein